jgi:hypothetical protein
MDRDTLLANEKDFALVRHWRNDDGSFAMRDGPTTRLGTRGRLHPIGHDFEMRISEMGFARDSFPPAFFHDRQCSSHRR